MEDSEQRDLVGGDMFRIILAELDKVHSKLPGIILGGEDISQHLYIQALVFKAVRLVTGKDDWECFEELRGTLWGWSDLDSCSVLNAAIAQCEKCGLGFVEVWMVDIADKGFICSRCWDQYRQMARQPKISDEMQ